MNIKELAKEYKYKIETHAHTFPMSPCADFSPQEVIEKYAKLGFDAVVITNHFYSYSFSGDKKEIANKRFLDDFYKAEEAAKKYKLKVIFGMEIHFSDSNNDYLLYGIDQNDLDILYDLTFTDYKTFYETFKNDRNVILQAHPFRPNMVLQEPELLDGIEVFNMHPGHNSKIGIAAQYAANHPHFIKTCGTDFHHEGHQGLGGILTKTLPKDSFEFAEILKSRDYLLDISGNIIIP